MKSRIWRNWEYLFIIVFFVITGSYVFSCGDNLYITVFDNLDSNIPWLKMLSDHDLFCAKDGTVPFLGGISRNYLSSEWKAYNWLYMLFPAFEAFVTGWFLKIILSMAGFCLLGNALFPNRKIRQGTILFCGFLYGILPTFPTSAFSFASVPLLLWLTVKLYKEGHWKYMLGIFVYPVLSDSTTFGVFACGYILVFFVVEWMMSRKPSWRMLAAVFVLGIGYVITEYRLFYAMLFSGVPSIRSTFSPSNISFSQMKNLIITGFLQGHHHSDSLHTYLVLPVCGIYFLFLNFRYIYLRNIKGIFADPYNWLMLWIGFNAIIFGVDETSWFKAFVATVLPPLSGFSFARTLWFNPFLWYFSFLVVLIRVNKSMLVNVLLILAFGVLCCKSSTYNFLCHNLYAAVTDSRPSAATSELTYREFYSEDLFDRIKEDIGYNGEWSVAHGMHPGVLNYNTISTLDGYLSSYPASYKVQFRKLMEPEFELDEANANYFDSWGGRAYIFSPDIPFTPIYEMQKEAALWIDSDVFRAMGGTYVFSRVAVTNAEDLEFEEVGIYTDDSSPYRIHLYRLKG